MNPASNTAGHGLVRVERVRLCDHVGHAAHSRAATLNARTMTTAPFHRPALCSVLLLLVLAAAGPLRAQAGLPAGTVAAAMPPDTIAERVIACTACHGNQGRAGSDGFYPRIAGKPAGYLYNQLINFRQGRRQYPLMIYMVEHQSDAYLAEMATYFSQLHPPYAALQPVTAAPAVLERGRQLVEAGDKRRNLPACSACHGAALTGVAPAIPGLLGLPRDYVSAQFGAWKNGTRRATAPDCMAQIAQRVNADDISAVAAWLAAQPIPTPAAPAAAQPAKLPLACGSAPG